MITPEQQLVVDDLYWNTTRSLRSIAEEFALSSSELTSTVTPLPSGVECWWCGRPVTFRRRSERIEAGRRYGRLRCACTALQPQVPDEPSLVDTKATVLVPVTAASGFGRSPKGGPDMYHASSVLEDGIAALARCGLRWTGVWRRVDITSPPFAVTEALADAPERTVVVPAIRHLATNDGDSLALFLRLVLDGWRVITSAKRRHVGSFHDADRYDEMLGAEDEWYG